MGEGNAFAVGYSLVRMRVRRPDRIPYGPSKVILFAIVRLQGWLWRILHRFVPWARPHSIHWG